MASTQTFDRTPAKQKAVLVHLDIHHLGGSSAATSATGHAGASDYDSDQREFEDLARSAGADVRAVIGGSRQRPDAGLFVGSGKADEVAAAVAADEADLAIFNHDLSPSQERNLEKILKCRVLDRAGLILDIFAARARSHEGKLQVELAQLKHLRTRLVRGWTHLERQKGGIGMRGPGESQLETDRRLVSERIDTLKRRLEEVRKSRAQNRGARKRNDIPTVSLVGYTNAGKSSLFNALTGDDAFASNQLFATLDTTMRRIDLPEGEPAVLADTVGFIRDLPHDLIAAFRATLEESREATLLLHVIDAGDPERMARIEQVAQVLAEIEADRVPRLQVFNKIDLREDEQARIERDDAGVAVRVYVSARERLGLDLLKTAIHERLRAGVPDFEIVVPPRAARLRAQLFELHAVRGETIDDEGAAHLKLSLPYERLRGLCVAAGVEPPPAPRVFEDWETAT